MKLLATTYRTLSGIKEIIELPVKKQTQWIIYKDNKPSFFVDLFDLAKESNAMMNSLVLCSKRTINEALILINNKNNINLSVPKISRLGFSKKIKSEVRNIDLGPIPKEWLSYSL